MTQMHADKRGRILPLPICVHLPRYLRAKVFSCSLVRFVPQEEILAKLRDAAGVQCKGETTQPLLFEFFVFFVVKVFLGLRDPSLLRQIGGASLREAWRARRCAFLCTWDKL
jgi:hypothetical protein